MQFDISDAVIAISGLGASSFALVDASKAINGGASNFGFSFITRALENLFPADVDKADTSNPVTYGSIRDTLLANWLNGTELSDQKSIAKTLIKLRLDPRNAAFLAGKTGVDPVVLTRLAETSVNGGNPTPEELNVAGRFDLLLTTLLDEAYQRADQAYRKQIQGKRDSGVDCGITGWMVVHRRRCQRGQYRCCVPDWTGGGAAGPGFQGPCLRSAGQRAGLAVLQEVTNVTWFLDLRASPVGGGVRQDPLIYHDDTPKLIPDLKAAIRNKDVLFATHGFNVTAAWGRTTLGGWEALQSLPAGTVYIAVLWPGDSSWAQGLDYPVEGGDAMASGNLLANFISNYLTSAASFSFASHSLGARLVLQAISKLARPVRRVMLMAGAIDDTCLGGDYAAAAKWVEEISVLASRADTVLEYAFPIGNLAAWIIDQGSPFWHAALGRDGPQSGVRGKVVSGWQLPDGWGFNHHDYLPANGSTPSPTPTPAPTPSPLPPPAPPALAIPVPFPGPDDPPPYDDAAFADWRPAWSAAITSTRLR